jgi:hypothetical protein
MTKHLYPRIWKHNESAGFGLIQDKHGDHALFTRNGHKTAFLADSAFSVEAAMDRSALTLHYTETFDHHVAGLDHAIVAEAREWFGETVANATDAPKPISRDAARLAVSLAATAQARKDLGVKTSEYHAQNVLLLDAMKKEQEADLRCQQAMQSRDAAYYENHSLRSDKERLEGELRQLRADKITLQGMNQDQAKQIRTLREVSISPAVYDELSRKYKSLKDALGTQGCDNSLKEIKRLQESVVCQRVLDAMDGIRKSLDIGTISDAVAKIEDLKSRERTPESMKRAERLKAAAGNAFDIETAVSRAEQAFKQLAAIRKLALNAPGVLQCTSDSTETLVKNLCESHRKYLDQVDAVKCRVDSSTDSFQTTLEKIDKLKDNQCDSRWGDYCKEIKNLVGVYWFRDAPDRVAEICKQNADLQGQLKAVDDALTSGADCYNGQGHLLTDRLQKITSLKVNCLRFAERIKHSLDVSAPGILDAKPHADQILQQRIEKIEGQLRDLRRDCDGKKLGYTDRRI